MFKVTVLMPVYNGARFLAASIESILNQTFGDYEFLIIDDKSTDDSKDMILSYNDRRIRLISNDENIGQMRTLNKGITLARGRYIARMDQDDTSLPERLGLEADALDKNSDVGLVYSDTFVIDEFGARRTKTLFSRLKPERTYVFDKLLTRNFIIGNTVMTRRSVFDEVGLFNPAYRVAAEYDLFLRIARKYKIDFIDKPLAEYRMHGENASLNTMKATKEIVDILMNLDRNGLTKKQLAFLDKMIARHTADLGLCHLFNDDRKSCLTEAFRALEMECCNPRAAAAIFMAALFPKTLIDYAGSFRKGWLE